MVSSGCDSAVALLSAVRLGLEGLVGWSGVLGSSESFVSCSPFDCTIVRDAGRGLFRPVLERVTSGSPAASGAVLGTCPSLPVIRTDKATKASLNCGAMALISKSSISPDVNFSESMAAS